MTERRLILGCGTLEGQRDESRPERPDLWPERTDISSLRADLRTKGSHLKLGRAPKGTKSCDPRGLN